MDDEILDDFLGKMARLSSYELKDEENRNIPIYSLARSFGFHPNEASIIDEMYHNLGGLD